MRCVLNLSTKTANMQGAMRCSSSRNLGEIALPQHTLQILELFGLECLQESQSQGEAKGIANNFIIKGSCDSP